MTTAAYSLSHTRSEYTIALARVILAATTLFALWLDAPRSPQTVFLAYGLSWTYLVYALALLLRCIWSERVDWWPFITHVVDIIVFSIVQYLTLGPSSPFFVYFLFSVFCGAIRWGWKGTLVTGAMVMVAYIGIAGSIGRRVPAPEFTLNRFTIRLTYLVVATGILVYLGRSEARLRLEVERLARWPAPIAADPVAAIGRVLEYGAMLMRAGAVLAVWENDDEPTVHEAKWSRGVVTIRQHTSGTLQTTTDSSIANTTFLCTGDVRETRGIVLTDATGHLVTRDGVPLHPDILRRLEGTGLSTAAMRTDLVSGRVFFSDFGTPLAEALALTDLVAREIGSSLDQIHWSRKREELAAREERIRVARDLHDGVLQALTGVRLELRALAKAMSRSDASLEDRLIAIERALAMEQRELRHFIAGLEPGTEHHHAARVDLGERLDSLRERLSLEWKTPVTLRVSPQTISVPETLQEAVPLMVHEAAVNALKHAQPSRVAVDVVSADGHLRIAVTDDGQGFPFKGSYDHDTLAAAHVAPRSLFDRVSALGGQLSIDSSDNGSRVEVLLSL